MELFYRFICINRFLRVCLCVSVCISVCVSGAERAAVRNTPRCAFQLQRAVAVKRVVQDVLDRSPRLQALTPPKTREVVQWCRQRGYTPPDPEPQRRDDEESMEDILTQIDSEPGEFWRRRSGRYGDTHTHAGLIVPDQHPIT